MLRKPTKKASGAGQSYWQSYSDMMAALLLMFILIMSFTLLRSLNLYEEKIRAQEEQRELLQSQQEVLLEQQKEMDALLEIKNEQQREIDEIIGVKMNIIEALSAVFQDSNLKIDIDERTGAISLDSSVLFDYNSAKLTPAGTTFLDDFLPLYLSVLLSDTYRSYISEIIIEGHTDTNGEYMYNLSLSQKRAYSVAEYCLSGENELFSGDTLTDLRSIMTANGKSFSSPVLDHAGRVDAVKSRRVEIKFRLQDEEMIEKLREILESAET